MNTWISSLENEKDFYESLKPPPKRQKILKKVMVLVQYCRIISAIGAVTPIPYILVIDSTLTCKKIWPETPSEFHSVGPKGYGSMELEHFQILLDEL